VAFLLQRANGRDAQIEAFERDEHPIPPPRRR
jgi:hypothetical protein